MQTYGPIKFAVLVIALVATAGCSSPWYKSSSRLEKGIDQGIMRSSLENSLTQIVTDVGLAPNKEISLKVVGWHSDLVTGFLEKKLHQNGVQIVENAPELFVSVDRWGVNYNSLDLPFFSLYRKQAQANLWYSYAQENTETITPKSGSVDRTSTSSEWRFTWLAWFFPNIFG